MGAQRDLKDSNEVIDGWVSHTHTREHTLTRIYICTCTLCSTHKYMWICDKLKVWERSLEWDNKMEEGAKMFSK